MEDPRTLAGEASPEDNIKAVEGPDEPAPQTWGTTGLLRRWGIPAPEQRLIAETLAWIAELLGAARPRLVRRLPNGIWVVQSLAQDKIVAQAADRAEIAMAWMIGLSGGAYQASRPRVTTPEGDGVRPIAVTSYVGIPISCRNEFLGVIEAAGKLRPDLDRALLEARPRLQHLAARMAFDPSVRAAPHVSLDTECDVGGGYGAGGRIEISKGEWDFIECLVRPMKLADLTVLLDRPDFEVLQMAEALSARGLVALRSPTGVLATSHQGNPLTEDALAGE